MDGKTPTSSKIEHLSIKVCVYECLSVSNCVFLRPLIPLTPLSCVAKVSINFNSQLKQQKTFQGTLGTQDLTFKGSKTSQGPSMDPTGPLNWSSKFSNILGPLSGYVYHFYIIHSLAPLTMLELFFGHCGTLPRLSGPSWTFMDPQMDLKMDPARLISGGP